MLYVYIDRYGYATRVISHEELVSDYNEDEDEFFRACEKLAPKASLSCAKGTIRREEDDFNFDEHNCAVAMDIADMQCQCGNH